MYLIIYIRMLFAINDSIFSFPILSDIFVVRLIQHSILWYCSVNTHSHSFWINFLLLDRKRSSFLRRIRHIDIPILIIIKHSLLEYFRWHSIRFLSVLLDFCYFETRISIYLLFVSALQSKWIRFYCRADVLLEYVCTNVFVHVYKTICSNA